jgi:Cu+-exporting ATPase
MNPSKSLKIQTHCDLCLSTLAEGTTERTYQGQHYLFCCPACAQVFNILGPDEARRQGPSLKAGSGNSVLPAGPYNEVWIKVDGLVCSACAPLIEGLLQQDPGVVRAMVEPITEVAHIIFSPQLTRQDALTQRLDRFGFSAQEVSPDLQESKSIHEAVRLVLAIVLGANAMMNAMVIYAAYAFDAGQNWLSNLVFMEKIYEPNPIPEGVRGAFTLVSGLTALPLLVYCGWPIFLNGFRRLKLGQPNTDTLVGFGALVAFIVSIYSALILKTHHVYFDTASMLVSLLIIGRSIEKNSKQKAQRFIQGLLMAETKMTQRWQEGEWASILVSEVRGGDRLRVVMGERVPVDGTIHEGEGWIDTSTLTGEVLPRAIQKDQEIFAGYLCQEGYIEMRATLVGQETVLATILDRVKRTLSSKTDVQLLADRLAAWFFPLVVSLSLATFFLAWAQGHELSASLMAGVSVLVVACPCALGLATPLVLVNAVGESAKRGLLLRSSEVLEAAAHINHVIFDKTGTLTTGQLHISYSKFEQIDERKAYQLAASLEQLSTHPLAQVFLRSFRHHDQEGLILPVGSWKQEAGQGLEGMIDGQHIHIGRPSWLKSMGMQIDHLLPSQDSYGSQVMLALDGTPYAYWEFTDRIREDAKEMIQSLKRKGIQIWLLSGDRSEACLWLAKSVGIPPQRVMAELLPHQKQEKIIELQQLGTVAMVGDGINDAIAISQANVGIAMSNGSGVALESAGVILVNRQLKQIPIFMGIAKQSLRRVRQNLVWAMAYNIALIPLAVMGRVHPIFAAAAMMLSSVSVILNSGRGFTFGDPNKNLEE